MRHCRIIYPSRWSNAFAPESTPVRVWRQHRGLTREGLAAAAGIAPSYLTEIETGKKPGSFRALARLAAALRISLDDIAAWTTANNQYPIA